MNSTLQYYADNARAFFDSTVDKEMHEAYQSFLPRLPKNSTILDAGCGSGRDSRYFISQGHRVDAIDASKEMAALASIHINQEVRCLSFDDITQRNVYDGIWAAASLLHLPSAQLPKTLSTLASALKDGGILYASFKYGEGEYVKEGRHFTPLNEEMAAALFGRLGNLKLLKTWLSDDVRKERRGEKWLNILAKKETYDVD